MTRPDPQLYTSKQLAEKLQRHINFVYGMRRSGFRMPGGTATLAEARAFLRGHPHPTARPNGKPVKSRIVRHR